MARIWLSTTLVLAGLLAFAQPVGAQSGEDSAELSRHLQAATRAAKEGDYEEAGRQYLEAYAIEPRPILLYNAAYSLAQAGRLDRAVELGARASREDLSDPNLSARNEARLDGWSAIRRGRSVAEQADDQPATARGSGAGERAPGRRSGSGNEREAIGLVAITAGVGSLTGALLIDAELGKEVENLRDAKREDDAERYDRVKSRIDRRQRTGRALTIGGALALTAGTTFLLWGLLDSDDGSARLQPLPRISKDSVGARIRWAF
jgi:tetratricopeptide (TPR) repeat protein